MGIPIIGEKTSWTQVLYIIPMHYSTWLPSPSSSFSLSEFAPSPSSLPPLSPFSILINYLPKSRCFFSTFFPHSHHHPFIPSPTLYLLPMPLSPCFSTFFFSFCSTFSFFFIHFEILSHSTPNYFLTLYHLSLLKPLCLCTFYNTHTHTHTHTHKLK